jgi:hypothetical protein
MNDRDRWSDYWRVDDRIKDRSSFRARFAISNRVWRRITIPVYGSVRRILDRALEEINR